MLPRQTQTRHLLIDAAAQNNRTSRRYVLLRRARNAQRDFGIRMEQRWKSFRAQGLCGNNNLPNSARTYAFSERRFRRINDRFRCLVQHGVKFRQIDKCSICARNNDFCFCRCNIGKNACHLHACFFSARKTCAGMNHPDFNGAFAREQNCSCSFTQNHSSRRLTKRLDWWVSFEQPPSAISVAQKPVRFFCTDDQAIIERFICHQIRRHFNRQNSDCSIAYQRVARATNPEYGREMACWSVKNRFWKEQRTGRLRPRRDHVVIETFCVNDAAIRDREDQCHAIRGFGVDLYARIRKRVETGGRCETRDCACAAEARMRRQIFQDVAWNPKNRIFLFSQCFRNGLRDGFFSAQQAFPHALDAASERRDPSRACDSQTHAANFCITMEAFVPPKPNEFERTMSIFAERDSFATMSRSTSSSGARKLMFGGRN